MARQKGINDFAVQESVAPYIKAVASDGSSSVDACRAIYVKANSNPVLTVNGTNITFTGLIAGNIYPICTTKSNSTNVIFLY